MLEELSTDEGSFLEISRALKRHVQSAPRALHTQQGGRYRSGVCGLPLIQYQRLVHVGHVRIYFAINLVITQLKEGRSQGSPVTVCAHGLGVILVYVLVKGKPDESGGAAARSH